MTDHDKRGALLRAYDMAAADLIGLQAQWNGREDDATLNRLATAIFRAVAGVGIDLRSLNTTPAEKRPWDDLEASLLFVECILDDFLTPEQEAVLNAHIKLEADYALHGG